MLVIVALLILRFTLIALSCISVYTGLKQELASTLTSLGTDIHHVTCIRDMISKVQDGDEQLLIMS